MTDTREIKNKGSKFRFTNAFKDLVAIIIICIVVLILSYFFNVFVFLVVLFQKYPKTITYIDEIIMGLLTLAVGFAVFSWRRWLELKRETAERIRLQEELIQIANVKAEAERIVSRQLQSEIEYRKLTEKIPHLSVLKKRSPAVKSPKA